MRRILLATAGLIVLFYATKRKESPVPPAAPRPPFVARVLFTDADLKRIDTRVRASYASALSSAMLRGGIDTVPRMAAFLGQIMHETAGFQFLTELASGAAYEGRADLGNTQAGDGVRFKGRGFIQLTGRANYRAAGNDLDLPLETQPELAARPDIAAVTAVWFWNKKKLNAKADIRDVNAITRAINGGTNGLAERVRLTENAERVLGTDHVS
jgi:predicted chitinase